MKKYILFILSIFSFGLLFSEDCDCLPFDDGYYHYYMNLKTDNVPDNFTKVSLMSTIKESKVMTARSAAAYETEITDAEKSFPTAQTQLLKQSVTIRSKNPDLEKILSLYTDKINFVEKMCKPEFLYEPNDYKPDFITAAENHGYAHLELINATQAWEITKGDPRILIGISDTYIEPTHEDLEGKIAKIIQNSVPGQDPDSYGHGVRVSGMAAAATDNNKGMAAIGFNSRIVFTTSQSPSNLLKMAQEPGVRVINCSWGNCKNYSITNEVVFQEIRNNNVIVTSGAGNVVSSRFRCDSISEYFYPASYESVIGVTSIGHAFDRGYITPGIGKHLWKDCHEWTIGEESASHFHNDKVNICAPGYRLPTTQANNTYVEYQWGTSLAAPIVAGVCALVASVNPCLTADEIVDIVLTTADPIIYSIPENAPYIGKLGTGRVDAYAAVKQAVELGTKYIQRKVYNANTIEKAATSLRAGNNINNTLIPGNVIINTGKNVTFKATREVELSAGFEVQSGASFTAEIYESECF